MNLKRLDFLFFLLPILIFLISNVDRLTSFRITIALAVISLLNFIAKKKVKEKHIVERKWFAFIAYFFTLYTLTWFFNQDVKWMNADILTIIVFIISFIFVFLFGAKTKFTSTIMIFYWIMFVIDTFIFHKTLQTVYSYEGMQAAMDPFTVSVFIGLSLFLNLVSIKWKPRKIKIPAKRTLSSPKVAKPSFPANFFSRANKNLRQFLNK